jgi:hypothetical protein
VSLSARSRGQTTLDFTIGVTIFVVVLAGVFLFVPGTLQPFQEGGQEDIVTVNRIADQLTEQSLVEPTDPYILSADCTVEFFEDSSDPDCGYSGSNLQERVGHGDLQFLNITIQGPSSGSSEPNILCYDDDESPGSRLESGSDCDASGETELSIGRNPDSVQSSVTARRVVELDGRDVFLVVQLW